MGSAIVALWKLAQISKMICLSATMGALAELGDSPGQQVYVRRTVGLYREHARCQVGRIARAVCASRLHAGTRCLDGGRIGRLQHGEQRAHNPTSRKAIHLCDPRHSGREVITKDPSRLLS